MGPFNLSSTLALIMPVKTAHLSQPALFKMRDKEVVQWPAESDHPTKKDGNKLHNMHSRMSQPA